MNKTNLKSIRINNKPKYDLKLIKKLLHIDDDYFKPYWTQNHIADQISIDYSLFSNCLSGKRDFPLRVMINIVNLLNKPIKSWNFEVTLLNPIKIEDLYIKK